MKRAFAFLFVSLSLVACAVEPDDATTPPAEEAEPTAQVQSELRPVRGLDDTKYCLPGEEVKCTLGPPPVCKCVAKKVDPPILIAW